jgi:hypothetical protein
MQLDESARPDNRHHAAHLFLNGQITDYHRRFIASMTSRAVLAVLRHLFAQRVMFRNPEAKVLEERWDACEKADTLDPIFFRLGEERFDKQAACSLSSDS